MPTHTQVAIPEWDSTQRWYNLINVNIVFEVLEILGNLEICDNKTQISSRNSPAEDYPREYIDQETAVAGQRNTL